MPFIFFLIISSFTVLAHQTSLTPSQHPIRWNIKNIPLRVFNTTSSAIDSDFIIDKSIAEWNGATSTKIVRVNNSANQIRFENNFFYGSAVIGITEVNYNSSGIINTASIILNNQHYEFSDNPAMSFGNLIYLGDVVTHELGHFVGLSHSEVLNSSLFFSTFPGHATIAADDRAGLRSKYESSFGKIFGAVRGGKQVGILGAHIQAISSKTGEAIGSISDENGNFEIDGLNLDDTYYLYVSPLKHLHALPAHYANVQNNFCPAAYVGSFFSSCGREKEGLPTAISLSAGQREINVGVVSIHCTLKTQEAYSIEKLQSNFEPLLIWNYAEEPRSEKAYVGYFPKVDLSSLVYSSPDKFVIDLRTLPFSSGKKLGIRLVSQPFGNIVEYSMVIKKNGLEISGSPFIMKQNDDLTYHLDLATLAALSTVSMQNIFEIEIKASRLSNIAAGYSIPQFQAFSSVQNYPYLLVLTLWDGSVMMANTEQYLSDNGACLDAPFSYSVKKSSIAQADDKTMQVAASASCGSLGPPSDQGPGSSLLLMTIGFIVSLLLARSIKSRKYFLS
jgi:hypothetical protein